MTKYNILVNILDTTIQEAPPSLKKKYPKIPTETEQLNQARSRAFIHLYLKVNFGILDFVEREHYITDGTYDGGIDGYYINSENKTIYFIQSKYRTNELNFETKQITLEEILVMDINRILNGELQDENGNEYNGKIKQLQREIASTDGIGRYSYSVVFLANLPEIKQSDLRKFCDSYACEVLNFEDCYKKLVFPIITGTFFNAADLSINIDLSNKNAGSKISYTVQTKKGKCEITVLFVPTVELGRIMYKYKNSILRYNPRSYLGHEGTFVNNSIRNTIVESETNEFALFNNGITMLSDETFINEKIGQKHKAQLIVKNPQIINGGQTSYTLSRIYAENIDKDVEAIFQNKEVLVKIITLQENKDLDSKIELINDISEATNKQTPVIKADKLSNEKLQVQLQSLLFEKYGLLYERKRGEFSDGIFNKYIKEDSIIERNLLYRMFYAANGKISKAKEKKLFFRQEISIEEFKQGDYLDNTYFGYLCFRKMNSKKIPNHKTDISIYAKVYAMVVLFKPDKFHHYESASNYYFQGLESKWKDFIEQNRNKVENMKTKINKQTGDVRTYQVLEYTSWFQSPKFRDDLIEYFKN